MLSQEDNELITNTNRGTPMGEVFRRFWIPVLMSEELPGPDCTPVRVQILGETLTAFRDTLGRIGLIDANSPHRGAPTFFGRNEDCGLRCLYHGWKYDVDGNCVDMPNIPQEEAESYRRRIHILSYPCFEGGNLVWAYMGPPDRKPPVPEFEWLNLPKDHIYVSKFQIDCNYLQAMEGDFDDSHAIFLHSTLNLTSDRPRGNPAPRIPPGRQLSDLGAFGWKESDSGFFFTTVRPPRNGR